MRAKTLGAAALLAVTVSPLKAEDCLICDREVVMTPTLARCFLERFDVLQTRAAGIIAVDLTDCPAETEETDGTQEQDRGVVAALTMPDKAPLEPSSKFMISRGQLVCLKTALEDETLPLDPAARIDLDVCE